MNSSAMGEAVRLFPAFRRARGCEALANLALELSQEVYSLRCNMTSDSQRETLVRVARAIALDAIDFLPGTRSLNCEMPCDWSIGEACMADVAGQRIYFSDFAADANCRS